MSKKKKTAKRTPRESGTGGLAVPLRHLRNLLLAFLAGYLGLAAFGCAAADRLIFPVPAPSYTADAPDLIKLPLQGGGEVPALWIEHPNARRTVLYFHGNAMDLGHCRPWLLRIRNAGYSVLAVEYPGYGTATGSPSEEGCYRAADAGYAYLRTTRGVPADKIVIYGMSLGTGVATDLAARQPAGALVLESPFLSTFRVKTGVKIVPFDRFDSLAKIDQVTCPLLIVHGDADRVVPFWHGKKLHEAATGAPRKQFYAIPGGGHGDLVSREGPKYWTTLARFLEASQ